MEGKIGVGFRKRVLRAYKEIGEDTGELV